MGRMVVSIYMKGDYEEFHALKAAKKQSQFKAKQSQSPGFGREFWVLVDGIVLLGFLRAIKLENRRESLCFWMNLIFYVEK